MIEEELDAIERVVRRVEIANEDSSSVLGGTPGSTGVLLTSAIPGKSAIDSVRVPRAASMVELIQQFADLSAQIDKQSTKSLSVQIDFPTDDFPRETADRLEIMSRCDRYVHALSVKDHMLWTAVQEKKKTNELLDEERHLSHEYAKEVASWAEVTQQLSIDMKGLKEQNETLERRNRELIEILRRHNLHYVMNPDGKL